MKLDSQLTGQFSSLIWEICKVTETELKFCQPVKTTGHLQSFRTSGHTCVMKKGSLGEEHWCFWKQKRTNIGSLRSPRGEESFFSFKPHISSLSHRVFTINPQSDDIISVGVYWSCVWFCQSVCVLEDQEQAVVRSLQYFKALVDRLGGDKLALNPSAAGGLLGRASSSILEGVETLAQLESHLKDR